jgi:hypothetical protein
MNHGTCPKCKADVFGAFCPDCGTARPAPADEMTEDERMAEKLEFAFDETHTLHSDTRAPWSEQPEDFRTMSLAFLARARALLQPAKLPDVEELALTEKELLAVVVDWLGSDDHPLLPVSKVIARLAAAVQRRKFLPVTLAAPPAQPRKFSDEELRHTTTISDKQLGIDKDPHA